MKYLQYIQKHITGFRPDIHWKIILIFSFGFFLVGMAYDTYLYVYAHRQIQATETIAHDMEKRATSTANLDIDQLFEVYKKREETYTNIVKTLAIHSRSLQATTTASTSQSSVATSSKQ